ncbi:hypothetical protein GCM10010116_60700 [Microbispora rosea subsp. aerata]|nr:histidine kinase [Microbispora rosea]GGO30307.1 hypothetical protein GCM10010116_60700 [Microbispora rosea subsp. aerata]GIH59097.1 hypothetical protein Mro02_60110 [Microbispora rosea subsp. aerata]GLJ85862.1 hypothetical protein GCM10017588_45950 [Microbispora rosea subsp. aerata]
MTAERLRFSRDLHDLLGHTLSVMLVKAEAVRRLSRVDADTAAAQAADIEQIGRQALAEVRAAVTGYRGRGLATEGPANSEVARHSRGMERSGFREDRRIASDAADRPRLGPWTPH